MDGVRELIHRRRRQILVHSIIYYARGTNIISDAQFDNWSHELVQLQADHPEDSEAVEYMREEFRDFTGDTGFHLPLANVWARGVAKSLLPGWS